MRYCCRRKLKKYYSNSFKRIEAARVPRIRFLRYRYNSKEQINAIRSVSRVEFLEQSINTADPLPGTIGIAHTRWATHGASEIKNTHPHFSQDTLAIVHNGIIENYKDLKSSLIE